MNERELMLRAGDDEDAPFGFTDDMAIEWQLGPHPGYLSEFVQVARLHTTAGFVSLLYAAMGAASAVAPPELHLRVHGTKVEGNVWPIIVGGSGTYKTTAALWGIDALEGVPHLRIPHPDSVQGLKEWYVWKHKGEKDPDTGERYGGDPFPRGFLAYDEMMGFWEETAPRQRLAGLRPLLTSLYDNKGVEKLTRQRENTFHVPYARLTIIGAVTPSTLEDYMTQNDWGSGFGARFMWGGAIPRNGIIKHDRPDDRDKAYLQAATTALANKPVTPCAGLTEAARVLYEEHRNKVRLVMPLIHRKLHGLFGRFDVNTLRVALLHAYTSRSVDQPGWRLNYEDINWARRVVYASLVCARVLFRRLAMTPYQKLRGDLVHFLRAGPRTIDELARIMRVKHRVLEEIITGLQTEKRILRDGTGGSGLLHWIPLDMIHIVEGTTGAAETAKAAAMAADNTVISLDSRRPKTPPIPPRPAKPPPFVVEAPVTPEAVVSTATMSQPLKPNPALTIMPSVWDD